MAVQIKRSDYPDYMSYLDAVAAPIGGVDSHVVWDEDEQEWVLEHDDAPTDDDASPHEASPLLIRSGLTPLLNRK
jgi:hypothetical protein